MALTRAAAATALARIDSDPRARERFFGAYTADEDARAALQEAADPALPSPSSVARTERLKGYERAAYGRASTPAEHAASAQARDEIAWEEDHRASVATALETAVAAMGPAATVAGLATVAEPVEAPPAAPAAPAAPVAPVRRRLRTRSVVAIAVIAGLLVGVVIAIAVGVYLGADRSIGSHFAATCSSCTATTAPTPTRSAVASTVTRTYTTKQIAGWFGATSTSDDTFPQPNYLTFIGLGSSETRFIATGDSSWSLWIGKSTNGETCLLLNGTIQKPKQSLSSCLPDKAIANGKPAVIDAHGINATLTSRDLVVALTSS